MNHLIFVFSLCFLLVGLAFIYQPTWIIRFNKIARERIFNDAILLLERRKKGILFLLLSCVFFYWGYYRAHYAQTRLIDKIISADRLLYQAHQHLYAKQYQTAKTLCERILVREPENADALYQLGAAQFLLNDPVSGELSWAKAEKLAPNSLSGRRLKEFVARLQNSCPPTSK